MAAEPRFLMLLPGLFWAGNAIVARSTVGEVPPIALAFWRWILGAAIVLPFAWPHLRRDARTSRQHWLMMVVLSALGISVFNTFLYTAAQTTTAINLVMLQSALPVLVVVATFVLFRESVTPRQGVGIAVSLAGALTLIAHGDPDMLTGLDFNKGDLWMLAAVVSYSIYTALLRHRPRRARPELPVRDLRNRCHAAAAVLSRGDGLRPSVAADAACRCWRSATSRCSRRSWPIWPSTAPSSC